MLAPSEPLLAVAAPSVPRGVGRPWLGVAGPALVWLTAVTLGFVALGRYSTTPGEPTAASVQWPATSPLSRAPSGRFTLLLFAHPKCPCTRATMGELAILMARNMARVEAQVLFVRPPGVGPDWERTDLWDKAAKIPGVRVRADDGGVEAVRFGATTSGDVFLYDAGGGLRFAGGITASRGQAGDNAGRSAVEALLAGGSDATARTPTYGCRLLAPSCRTKDATCER
jgi:hypothetical protein